MNSSYKIQILRLDILRKTMQRQLWSWSDGKFCRRGGGRNRNELYYANRRMLSSLARMDYPLTYGECSA